VPHLHTQLPEDLAFTKEQDDIKDKKEFDYDYLLVMNKFTVDNELVSKAKNQQTFVPTRDSRLYYRWEDDILESAAKISFCF
jgi:hypothetical protein